MNDGEEAEHVIGAPMSAKHLLSHQATRSRRRDTVMNDSMRPISPGYFLRDALKARSWSQADLAWVLGLKPNIVSLLACDKRSISAKMAKALSAAFGLSAYDILVQQNVYNLSKTKEKPMVHISLMAQRPPEVAENVWDEFKALRKAKRAPFTRLALNGIERECAKANITLEAALTLCIERGWQGFNAEWVHQPKPDQGYYDPEGVL